MSNPENKLRTRLIGLTKYFLYSIFSLYILVWLLSPFVVNYYLGDFLKTEHGLKLSSTTGIRYNPFTSHLTIKDLEISKDQQSVFAIDSAELEVRLHRLLIDQIYVSQFEISGLHIESKQQQELLEVAGIILTANSNSDTSMSSLPSNEAEIESLEQSTKGQYSIVIPSINFDRKTLALLLNEEQHHLKLKQVELRDLLFAADSQKLKLDIAGELNDAQLSIRASIDLTSNDFIGNGNGILEFSLKGFELSSISALLADKGIKQSITGKVDFSSSIRFASELENVAIDIGNLNVGFRDLSVTEQQLNIALKELLIDFNLPVVEIDLNASNPLNKLFIPDTTFNLKSLDVSIPGLKTKLNSSRINIKPIELTNNRLFIDKFLFDIGTASVMKSNFKKNQMHQSSADYKLDDSEEKIASRTANKIVKSTETDANNFSVLVNNIMLNHEGTLTFEDSSVEPSFSKTINLSSLSLNNIASAKPSELSDFMLTGIIDQYTKFEFKGNINPFSQEANLSINGSLVELSLPEANGYVAPLLGFDFKSGNLDTSIDLEIIDSEISGSTDILIKGLDLSSAENHHGDIIEEQTSLPLNVALGMLKDSDDNVELNIPMMGNLNSPTFGFGSFVALITKKAIQSAATSYLMKTFLPYAEILSVTLSAGDFIMKTRFEDLLFESAQTQLSETQIGFMKQFVDLMKDKKDTRVKVCAISTLSDIIDGSLSEKLKITKLHDISRQRMDIFKSFVTEREIESSRILLCKPQIDLKDSQAGRIEISI